ncbi:PpkA [Rhodovastum atsumiense]|uniref:VWA domain-containing protein n=1 Tax=Rhodovastum atsumiense TaxID=504468 RepID=A0A5M6IV51_9PROT|nr:vWA domain-containing protein [Rhodovastum atsumiense]KAA5612184.1 VWA domain-containing protein [Rhodovastum atsumiense]CAH2603862.1 PpkA [Rhodovastum atsumiense]
MHRRLFLAAGLGLTLPHPGAAAPPAAPPAGSPPAGERQALLIEGKRTLRQRALTRPGAAPRPQPGASGAQAALPPLTPLYVFARRPGPDGQEWLELGRAQRGPTLGWLPATDTIPWAHTMTAAFQNPAARERTLFFRERAALIAMLGGAHPEQEAHGLALAAARRPVPADFPVTAVEPPEHVDINRQFYLLPILQAEQITFQDGREYRALEVASIPITQGPPPARQAFGVGIAFVVDTTLSMDPYIERVRAALNEMVRATAGTGQNTRYALIGFRNSLEAQPRLEYVSRVFARFADNADPASFARRIAEVRATNVDSLSFNEDSFAAVLAAVRELDWGDLAARVVVLVTDAGSRAANDRFSSTRLGPTEIGAVAREAGVAVMALHLLTPAGANNHAFAEAQYKTLTAAPFPTLGPQYFPVPAGDPAAMDRMVRQLLASLREVAAQPGAAGAPPAGGGAPIGRQAALLGHAMRLDWLGRQNQTTAPAVLRGWAADGYRAANPPECLEVRVLLTRNQLNDLAQAVQMIIEQGRANMIDSNAMFDRLQSVAAHLSRDPERLRERGLENLGGLLGEYLDDLPYLSAVATLDRDTWRSMLGGPQIEFLDNLETRLRAYREYNRSAIWTNISGGNDPGEEVFPVPLAMLP